MPEAQSEFKEALARALKPAITSMAVAAFLVIVALICQFQFSRQVARADNIIRRVHDAQLQIAGMDRAQRLSLQSGGSASQEGFDSHRASISVAFDRLERAVRGDSTQRERVGETRAAATEWASQIGQTLSAASALDHKGIAADPAQLDAANATLDTVAATAAAARAQSEDSFKILLEILVLAAILLLLFGCLSALNSRGEVAALYGTAVETRQDQIDSLRRSQSLLSTTLHSMGEAVVSADLKSRITFVNPVAEKLTDWEEADAVGKEVSKVISLLNEKTGAVMEFPVAKVLQDSVERKLDANMLLVGRDGRRQPISGRCSPVWDETGAASGVAIVFHDVSESRFAKEALRSSEAHREAIFETALDCIFIFDHEGMIVEFNPAAEATFGYRRGETLGQPFIDLIVPPAHRMALGLESYLKTGNPAILDKRIEISALRKNKSEFPVELAITAIDRTNPPLYATYLRDISDRKEAEAVMRRAKEAAEAESQAKSLLLNNMSDELRTPLNAVIGYSELLQEELMERDLPDLVPDLLTIQEAGGQLLTLINEILDLSKIEAGKMTLYLESFNLPELIQDTARGIRQGVAKNGNHLDIQIADGLGVMHADRIKVRQSLIYLISNASKLTRDRKLLLEVAREKSNDRNWIVFRVKDTSGGMPDKQMAQLLEALAAVDTSGPRSFDRHGMGLVIAQQMCEMMGGDLSGTREAGHSPVFSIRLPEKVEQPAK